MIISKKVEFSASHICRSAELSDEENERVYGAAANPLSHGHNYVVEVVVGGEVDAVTGMVCDLGALDECVRREVVERFDYSNLNFDTAFEKRPPTTENLNIEIYTVLRAAFTQAEIVEVRVEETAKNSFAYPVGSGDGKAVAV